ncbi:MAG: adenylate/guanylate cyclase domain-containing protein, partial [Phycisphaerae bacterium]
VVRRLPLVVDLDGFLVPQLGFALACNLLGVDLSSLGFDDGDLTLADADGRTYRVPLGPDGRSLLNWHLDRDHPQWRNSFEHLPVTRVMELVENRRIISQNQSRYALRMAQAVELVRGGPGAAYAEYEQAVRQLNRLTKQQASGLALSEQEQQRLATEAGPLTERVAGMQADALAMLEQLGEQIEGLQPESPEEERVFAQVRSLSRDLLAGQLKRQIEADNAELAARNQELAADLRSHIQGKACFVGYTAAAVSDFVNTPVYKSAPGVLAHANMVNSLLQDRFVRLAPRWLNALLMVLAGLTMTLLAATRGPWVSLISVLLLISALLLASILLFVAKVTYVASAVAALTVFICWAFITLYRQLTEQQAKRQFSRALAQYTSPAVAAQIARQARVEDLAPRPREVTCFFSDLKGFTSISERLGAERTRELLNPYLEAMSQVLLEHRAMINKFMGDGIFAFFNPPIMECSDHAQRACAAAVESVRALQGLKERFADITLGQDMAGLEMRVGIHTGDVFVGDYGSASKLDYTCIGDTVNLAARLEPANKAFGTCLMISQATQEQLDGRFVCRPLGKLQVVGKKQAVSVFELLGRSRDLNAEQVSYAEDFARAVALFQARQWDQAKAAFQHCQQARQADGAAKLYLRHIAAFQDHPPPDDWNQGIELTSK